jgi:hypothetical protein
VLSRGRRVLVLSLLAAIAACEAERPRVREYLDPQTAVTIRAMNAPFVYAREVPEIAVNVRDYLSLGAVEVNNMGTRKHYLVLVAWSTVDRGVARAQSASIPEHIQLTAGGRTLELAPVGHDARSLGIGDPPYRPPTGFVAESWYAVTTEELRRLAAAPPTEIVLRSDAATLSYSIWRAAPAELDAFVRDIPGPPAQAPAPISR